MIRVFVAVLVIVTLTWCETDATKNDVAEGNYLFDKTNKNLGKNRERSERSVSISVDGGSSYNYNSAGGCIGDCCSYDDECKGEHVKCDWTRKICVCKEGFILNQDGKCVNCSEVDFENDTQTCPGVTKCKECETCKPNCKDKLYDVIIIMDGSGSVGPYNYEFQHYHLLEFVSQFDISPNNTRLGLIPFSTDVYNSFDLNDPNVDTTIEVIAHIQNDIYMSGLNIISLALAHAKNILESPGNRPDVPNKVIVLTDGSFSLTPTIEQAAQALKNISDTTVSFIGLGTFIHHELGPAIASSPGDIYNGTYENISALTVDLIEKLCG